MTAPRLAAIAGRPLEEFAERPPDPPDPPGGGEDGGGSAAALPPKCPVTPLGHRNGVFHYLSPAGQLRGLGEREHSALGLTGLFEGRLDWLFEHYPKLGRVPRDDMGKPIGEAPVVGWQYQKAAAALMAGCAARGLFDPERGLRGPGAWRGPDGALILHCGDELFIYSVDGDANMDDPAAPAPPDGVAAGKVIDGIVYAAAPAEAKPAADAAGADVAEKLHALLKRWQWRAPVEAPRLVLGWIAQAYLCGALDWRAAIWVTGDKGVGKTTLQELVFGLHGDSLWKVSDPSAAGLRQALNGAARPIAIDEIEASETNSRAGEVVELARLCATDAQGRVLRGSAGGEAKSFTVKAALYLTSVLHPPFKPQDLSRITVLELDPLPLDAAAAANVAAAARALVKEGPGLRARMAEAWASGRLRHNLAVFEAAIKRRGQSARFADQFGTLLACAETLLTDHPAVENLVDDFLAGFSTAEFTERGDDADHDLCLNHLLSAAVDHWTRGHRLTVGQLIHHVLEGSGGDAVDALARHGMKVVNDEALGQGMLVANHHQGLEAIFAGARWQGGVWAQSLRRVPGACKVGSARFGHAVSRCVWLPAAAWSAEPQGPPAPEPPDGSGERRPESGV